MENSITAIDTKPIESNLSLLEVRTKALIVRDQSTFIEARTIQKDWDTYIKNVGFELDPGIAKAKGTLDHLKDQKEKYVGPAKLLKESIRQRADEWAAEEKRQAQIEEDRKNAELARAAQEKAEAERRENERIAKEQREAREKELAAQRKAGEIGKREEARLVKLAAEEEAAAKKAAAEQAAITAAAPPQVAVKPNIPTVAGIKNQTYYMAEITDSHAIIDAYAAAFARGDQQQAVFLYQFIVVDAQAVGKFARDTKDNATATKALPGVKFYSKG